MELLDKQSKLAGLIYSFWNSNHQLAQDTSSEGSVRCCLEILEGYWNQFKSNHEQLSRIESLKQNDLQIIYQSVQRDFIKTKGLLYDEKSKLGNINSLPRERSVQDFDSTLHNNSIIVKHNDANYLKDPITQIACSSIFRESRRMGVLS